MIRKCMDAIGNICNLAKYFLLPNLCLVCKNTVSSQDEICIDCWHKLKFITSQTCTKCLEPLTGTEILLRLNRLPVCPACYRNPPYIDQAKAVFSYTAEIRNLIIKFKHHDTPELAIFFSNVMANTGDPLFQKSDFVIPVPIHGTKMRIRKYNQAFILAKYLVKFYNKNNRDNKKLTLINNVLYKAKKTKSQEGRTQRQRKYNIKNSFSVKNSHIIKNKNILIIDDVHTTGSTLNECAKILKQAGANQIFTLTIAKVQKDSVMSVYDIGIK